MNNVLIMYPRDASSRFDMDYYATTHMPLFVDRLGECCIAWGIMEDSGEKYHAIAWATVTDMDEYYTKMSEHGSEIFNDVKNYTEVRPVVINGAVVARHHAVPDPAS